MEMSAWHDTRTWIFHYNIKTATAAAAAEVVVPAAAVAEASFS